MPKIFLQVTLKTHRTNLNFTHIYIHTISCRCCCTVLYIVDMEVFTFNTRRGAGGVVFEHLTIFRYEILKLVKLNGREIKNYKSNVLLLLRILLLY